MYRPVQRYVFTLYVYMYIVYVHIVYVYYISWFCSSVLAISETPGIPEDRFRHIVCAVFFCWTSLRAPL
jgi:hypothetical protein